MSRGRRLRVLLATPDFPPARGGIQTLLHGLAKSLPEVDLRVVTRGGPDAEAFDAGQSFEVVRVPSAPAHRALIAALNLATVREGRRFGPDVAISGHIVMSPGVRAVGCPWVQYLYAKELGARAQLARRAIRAADAAIAISEHTRLLALQLGVPLARVHVIPPGIDLPPRAAKPRIADPRPIILTVARLEDRYKGCDTLIRALPLVRARVPGGAELAVVGNGSLRPWLERLGAANRVGDAVRFIGDVSDAERDDWFDRSAVFAMPSRLPAGGRGGEGFGIVYLEASARGVPVVAGNVGGALDAVQHAVTGLLVDPCNHVAVADALTRLLVDPVLHGRLAEAGPAWADRFAWQVIAARVREILVAVIAGRAPVARHA